MSERGERVMAAVRSAHGCTDADRAMFTGAKVHP